MRRDRNDVFFSSEQILRSDGEIHDRPVGDRKDWMASQNSPIVGKVLKNQKKVICGAQVQGRLPGAQWLFDQHTVFLCKHLQTFQHHSIFIGSKGNTGRHSPSNVLRRSECLQQSFGAAGVQNPKYLCQKSFAAFLPHGFTLDSEIDPRNAAHSRWISK